MKPGKAYSTGSGPFSRALSRRITWTSRTSSDASVARVSIVAEAIAHRVSCSLFRDHLPSPSCELGSAPAAPPHHRRTASAQQLAMPAWVTERVSYKKLAGGVACCDGLRRVVHSSSTELDVGVMGPCLAHRALDASAAEQGGVASVESGSSRLLTPSVLSETRSWAARQPHLEATVGCGSGRTATRLLRERAPPCTSNQ